jgi:hypothetical protein
MSHVKFRKGRYFLQNPLPFPPTQSAEIFFGRRNEPRAIEAAHNAFDIVGNERNAVQPRLHLRLGPLARVIGASIVRGWRAGLSSFCL